MCTCFSYVVNIENQQSFVPEKSNENHCPAEKGFLGWIRCLQVGSVTCPSLMLRGPNASNMLLLGLKATRLKSTRSITVAGKRDTQQNPRHREAHLAEFSVTPWLGYSVTT